VTSATSNGESPLRVGVSSCLLGREVRFDGGHKRSRFLTDLLGEFVEWVPVCPEVEVGMGTPRPALRLVREEEGDGSRVRMVEIASGHDHTRRMETFASRRVNALRRLELSGYVLKKDSPSCGMTRVKVYGGAMAKRDGRGLYAAALMAAYPNLPVEDEGRLNDPGLRENFIERVFAYRRLRELFRGRWTNGQVVAFHTAESGFMAALTRPATRGKNANVLQHAAGHLKKLLDSASRTELAELIHDYRKGLVPLVVPLTLMAHHVRHHDVEYLKGQIFLEPHPKELMLRNHV
jgi:uncharacterized protein YbbK (DUF523 family)/uncharacterized protein YbgA (DUF1722 family)